MDESLKTSISEIIQLVEKLQFLTLNEAHPKKLEWSKYRAANVITSTDGPA